MTTILNGLVYSNSWVGLSVVGLSAFTVISNGASPSPFLLFILFLFTVSAYWFLRHPQDSSPELTQSDAVQFQLKHKRILRPLAYFTALLGIALVLNHSFPKEVLYTLAVSALLSIVYSTVVVKNTVINLGLRGVPGVKIIIIALVWGLVTFVIPLQEQLLFDWNKHWVGFLERVFFIIAITLPFDIRDMQFDTGYIKTIPLLIGAKNAKVTALLFVTSSGLLAVYQWWLGIYSWQILLAIWLTLEATTLFVWLTSPKRKDLFYSFGVESLPIILFFLLLIFRYF